MRGLIIALAALVAGCGGGGGAPTADGPPPVIVQPPPAAQPLPLVRIDDAVGVAFRDDLTAITAAASSPDARGLINENRTWGDLFSPRFQVGAGFR